MGSAQLQYGCILLLLYITAIWAQSPVTYMLPNIQVPSTYLLHLKVTTANLNGTSSTFEGNSEITFQVKASTNFIAIHSAVEINSTTIIPSTGSLVGLLTQTYNPTTEILTLTLSNNETFAVNTDYVLRMQFTGRINIEKMHGLYRSQYIDGENRTQYLLTTQFESAYARQVFPCFDEPRYKANFIIAITYPKVYSVLSNTGHQKATPVDEEYEKVTFQTTPKMSTYLIAFTISKFTCTTIMTNNTLQTTASVCSRAEVQADRIMAANYSTKILAVLENITNIQYSDMTIGKIDHLAIPDFEAGAMENWGLITYRESRLLWNQDDSPDLYMKNVICTMAHELAHMWFGNLVTLDWWNNAFLNEGFARYFEYFSVGLVDDFRDWEMDMRFVIEIQQSAFMADAQATSPSLTKAAVLNDEITEKFGTITYNKGASIFRMLENLIGTDNFINGLRSYLSTHKMSSVKPSNLWSSLQSFAINVLPSNKTLEQVMTNWIDQAGFPVVTARLNGTLLTISQEYFLYNGSESREWYVPISYVLSNPVALQNVSNPIWLEPGKQLTLTLTGDNWILLNNRGSAYYRVNYCPTLWGRINATLRLNHTQIDVLSRAQLVDDLLNLARAKLVKYTTALDILQYLQEEIEYYPWHAALNGFAYIFRSFDATTEVGKKLRVYFNDLRSKVYAIANNLDNVNQAELFKRVAIINMMNQLQLSQSVDIYLQQFIGFKLNGTSVNKNLRSVVYCNSLRLSNNTQSDWEFLWNRLQNTNIASEKEIILTALGCTRDKTILQRYLDLSVSETSGIRRQDITYVWQSVVSSNIEGVETAIEYFNVSHAKIKAYNIDVDTIISTIAARLNTDEQIKKFSEILNQPDIDNATAATIRSKIQSANDALKWRSEVRGDFEDYFNIITNNNTVPTFNVSSTTPKSNVTSTTTATTASSFATSPMFIQLPTIVTAVLSTILTVIIIL